ncbi:AAA family ATPase [Streptomyces sp. NPDC060022]|uniref:helix-turn-helix transcriptional regulator n=1 Tax=Streptomyces sp. NPDC060022 TaxID=3347039 RepID=UPI0036C78433
MAEPQTHSLGPMLRGFRRAADLTLEELADASGVSDRAIGDMERGHSRGPQARTVQALAEALSLSPENTDMLLAAARAGRRRAAPANGGGGGHMTTGAEIATRKPWISPPRRGEPTMASALPARLVGREAELTVLQDAVARLQAGTGGVVLVEGEPGIGKSSLVTAATAASHDAGCTVLFGSADQATHPLPLRLLYDCLGITQHATDPRSAEILRVVRAEWPDILLGNAVHAAVPDMLVTLIEEDCASAPTMMVLDDVQWADDMSLDVCQRLASNAAHLPLLLVLSCRPVPLGWGMRQLRAALRGHTTASISLGPLGPDAIHELLADVVGAPPGPALVDLAAQTSGNPLYARELVESLVREGGVTVGEHAELRETSLSTVRRSLAAALDSRLSFVGADALGMLRVAALLGREFAVTEVAALLDRSTIGIADDLQEAVAAGILIDAGQQMAFRHPLIRQALYDGMPTALRVALHQDAARALHDIGSVEPQRVAQQLLESGNVGNRWARRWLADSASVLAVRAPHIATELLHRELEHGVADERDRAALSVALAQILIGTGDHEQAAIRARQALAVSKDPADRGRMYWVLARALFSGGDNHAAVAALEQALKQSDVPDAWRARLLASLAMFQRAGTGALDAADATARRALEIGENAGDMVAVAYALTDLWANHSVQRQHLSALECVDQALKTLNNTNHADLRAYALHARIFTLQNLSRWSDAEEALRDVRQFLFASDRGEDTMSSVTAAVLMYWLGQWDDALAELDSVDHSVSAMTYRGLRESGPVWLWRGVTALIAVRRGDRATADAHLKAGLRRPPVTIADRENADFILVAQAFAAEQDGDQHRALSHLGGLLTRQPSEMTLIHQWLPGILRLALAVDDRSASVAALRACRTEAAAEQVPARATAAADWCTGLYERDTAPLRSAIEHYRTVGVSVEQAGALEDLAVVLAEQGNTAESEHAFGEALGLYSRFGAAWDIRRAEARLRQYGIRSGARGARPERPTHGWDALTSAENRVALLVATGSSTSDIAQDMYLTRRTVQTHISHILAKLGMSSRVEIAREASNHHPPAIPTGR